jgi:hypothetical protein
MRNGLRLMASIALYCANLRSLHLAHAKLCCKRLLDVLNRNSNLSHLETEYCNWINTDSLASIPLHSFKSVTSFSVLSGDINPDTLRNLTLLFGDIVKYRIAGLRTEGGSIFDIVSRMTHLQHLCIFDLGFISEAHALRIAESHSNLVHLDLPAFFVTNQVLLLFGACNPHLRSAELTHCYALSGSEVVRFAKLCKSLTALNVTQVYLSGLQLTYLADVLPLLEQLSFRVHPDTAQEDIVYLITTCRRLKCLHLMEAALWADQSVWKYLCGASEVIPCCDDSYKVLF